jgi:hypothetical protein
MWANKVTGSANKAAAAQPFSLPSSQVLHKQLPAHPCAVMRRQLRLSRSCLAQTLHTWNNRWQTQCRRVHRVQDTEHRAANCQGALSS